MAERLPFDPGRTAARRRAAETPSDTPMRVGELAGAIDAALKAGLPKRVRVVGEISGFRERTHWYFDLKDEQGAIGCVVFASSARKMRITPAQGMSVVVSGRCDFYAPSGKISLIIDSMEPVGEGALDAQLRALMAEYRELGWFNPESKQAIPAFPRRVAVVTSRSGAALQDVIDTMRRRCPAVGLLVADARVQGPSAAAEVARAIDEINERAHELGVDAILVTRGGGSLEDLWAFNERPVAEAIHRSRLPVVAAIGHETDTTIAELVADERCATPTQAATRLTPDRGALAQQVDSLARRVRDALLGEVRYLRQRVRSAGDRPVLTDPRAVVLVQRERLEARSREVSHAAASRLARSLRRFDAIALRLERHRPSAEHARRDERLRMIGERLARVARRRVRDLRAEVDSLDRELDAVSPLSVLARGYSVTLDASGRAITDASEVSPGERVRTRVSRGSFGSVVEGSEGASREPAGGERSAGDPEPSSPKPRIRPRRRRSGSQQDRDQLDLFGRGG